MNAKQIRDDFVARIWCEAVSRAEKAVFADNKAIGIRTKFLILTGLCRNINQARFVFHKAKSRAEKTLARRKWRKIIASQLMELIQLDTSATPEEWGLKKPTEHTRMVKFNGKKVRFKDVFISWSPEEMRANNLRRASIARKLSFDAPLGSKEEKDAIYLWHWFEDAARQG
jgi:hypothetical protein